MADTFTVDPDPPVHGKQATICHPGPYPAHVTITFVPGEDQSYSVPEPGCITIDVPDGAVSLNVHDDDLVVPDLSRAVG